MEWPVVLILLVGLLSVFLVSGVWIAVVLGVTGIGILIADGRFGILEAIGSIYWTQSGSFILLAIPLFILMGEIILASHISSGFYRSISPWVRYLPGGLLNSNILACSIFAAVSGSSVATAAAIGTVAVPELRNRGYDDRLTYGTIAAGGTLGILIPPSSAMIIYGSMVNENIAKLFIAGIFPGLMLTALFIAYIVVICLFKPELAPKSGERITFGVLAKSIPGIVPMAILMLSVIGSIYTGVVTPTEAAALGTVGALVIGLLVGQLSWSALGTALMNSVVSSGMIMFIILGAQILSFAIARTGASRALVEWIVSAEAGAWTVFVIICILYLILGCFIDAISMMVLTLPLVHPLMTTLGFDSLWFGVVLVILIEIGLITPPVGLNLFVLQNFAGKPGAFRDIVMGSLPFVGLMLFGILILCIWPQIATWLPN